MLKFNGVLVTPEPSVMNVTIQDISTPDSGRSGKTGLMYKFVVAPKRTIHLEWNNPEQDQARKILQQLKSGSNSAYVEVNYDGDPEASGRTTRTFYYGDISAAFQQVWVTGRKRYSKLQFDLIER